MARDIYEDADAVDAEPKGEGLTNGLVIVKSNGRLQLVW